MLVSALIEVSAPICIERWEDYKMLGRFTLRDEGELLPAYHCFSPGEIADILQVKPSLSVK
jgi:translation elongation factor EF-1alpha